MQQINLEQLKFEANLITESIKTGDANQAATNLQFLVNTGLLSGTLGEKVKSYLINRKPGEGRVFPAVLVYYVWRSIEVHARTDAWFHLQLSKKCGPHKIYPSVICAGSNSAKTIILIEITFHQRVFSPRSTDNR